MNNDYIIDKKKEIHCQNDLLKFFDLKKSSIIQSKRSEILKKSNPSI